MRQLIALFVMTAFLSTASHCFAEEPTVVDVWPGKAPGETRPEKPEKNEKSNIIKTTDVFKPTLTIFHAPKDSDTGASVIICPGGGYSILAWDLEGTEVAQWLNSVGVTGIVLKYRVPAHRTSEMNGFIPVMDAQRAVSLTRSKAKEWNVDANRIGILGFSAGGHLSAVTCTEFDHRSYTAIDDADKESCRPDFGVLVYPAYLSEGKEGALSSEFHITSKAPPMFIIGAADDGITNIGSPVFYTALLKAKVPVELHLYAKGGHGFGLRPSDRPCSTWPARCADWMKSEKLLEKH